MYSQSYTPLYHQSMPAPPPPPPPLPPPNWWITRKRLNMLAASSIMTDRGQTSRTIFRYTHSFVCYHLEIEKKKYDVCDHTRRASKPQILRSEIDGTRVHAHAHTHTGVHRAAKNKPVMTVQVMQCSTSYGSAQLKEQANQSSAWLTDLLFRSFLLLELKTRQSKQTPE